MEYAKLKFTLKSKIFKFLNNWYKGSYLAIGYDKAENDLEEIYILRYLIDNYNRFKYNRCFILKYLNKEENVDLSLKGFISLENSIENYLPMIDSITQLLKCNTKFWDNKINVLLNLITFDLVSTPPFPNAKLKL